MPCTKNNQGKNSGDSKTLHSPTRITRSRICHDMDKFTILNKLNLLEAFSLLYTYIYIYIFVNELKHIPRIFLPLFRFIFFFFFFFYLFFSSGEHVLRSFSGGTPCISRGYVTANTVRSV